MDCKILSSSEIDFLASLSDSELSQFLESIPTELIPKILQDLESWEPPKIRAEKSLAEFVAQAWGIIEPDIPFASNWHIDMICDHLEAVARGIKFGEPQRPIDQLLINVPPGCMKSLLTCVFWPAWVWTWWPSSRWLFASYDHSLSIRDSLRHRTIIESAWFQSNWRLSLSIDQNAKTKFANEAGGWRIATSVTGRGTGEHPDFIVVDDPHNVKQSESDVERERALNWWDGTIATRGKSRGVKRVVIMQRLHERDLSAHLLEKTGWTHICLPMRFELGRMETTPLGWQDLRESPGELLWPSLLTEEVTASIERDMGSLRAAGQLQQRPTAIGGGLFQREWFLRVEVIPAGARAVRYWDKAGTEGAGDWTVGVLLAERDGFYYVVDVVRGQWSFHQREQVILQTAHDDQLRAFKSYSVWIEQEPGSGGKESAQRTIQMLAGFNCRADKVSGRKELRWEPWAAQLEAGNVYMLAGGWNQTFRDEHLMAPVGEHDDQIDASAGAFSKLATRQRKSLAEWAESGAF